MNTLRTSAVGRDSHTPLTPRIPGRMSSGIIRKISVRKNARIPEVFPPLSAVNMEDANRLNPINKKAGANTLMPSTDISTTCSVPFAYKRASGFAAGYARAKVRTESPATVKSAHLKSFFRLKESTVLPARLHRQQLHRIRQFASG